MLSPTKGFVEKHTTLIAQVLVNAQPTIVVPLRLFHPSNRAVIIKEGAAVGLLQSAKVLPPPSAPAKLVLPNSSPAVPEHLQELNVQSSKDLDDNERLSLELANLSCLFQVTR